MVDYFSSALAEVIAKADFGAGSPIQSLSGARHPYRPGSELAVCIEVPFTGQRS
jgi:hypothetical protein